MQAPRITPPASGTSFAEETDRLELPAAIRISGSGHRHVVRTVSEALDMIADELPAELRRLPRWTFARALLEEARRTQRKRDLATAARQLKQALSNEGWLAADEAEASGAK
jgi:hypothetical protein